MSLNPDSRRTGHLAFGPFVLLPERQLLLRNDQPVRLGGRALEILALLARRPGDVVSKRELMEQVWSDTVVDDGNLKVNIAMLRRALGDGPGSSQYIATVTGRGYRFVAPVQAGNSDALVAPAAVGSRRDNIPTRSTRVFGRSETMESVRRDLDRSRLVSLVGAGGIGKTTVALEVAEQMLGAFEHGVWLIDLALLKDGALVPNAIATAIGLTVHSVSMLTPLCEFLHNRKLLLVIDNCEHVIDTAAACVNRILAESAGVRILVTSREPLLVKGERVRRLPGLAAPAASESLNAAQSLAFPAIQLFVERATERLESFTLSDSDAPRVAEICRRLDGLALAIEFAATRVDAFSVNGLLRQLDDRFRLLQGRRAGPERHRTLAATLDWSYGLLSDAEARLLRAVSVFAGGFDSYGAAAVASIEPGEAAEELSQLAAKSLLASDLGAAGVQYRLLETTRAYCAERLCAAADEPAVRERHAQYICMTLERAAEEWAKRPAGEWSAAYGRFIGDLRLALAWSSEHSTQRTLRIRLTVAGLLLWNHFSLTAESRVHASSAVEELDAAGMAGTVFEMKLKLWLAGSTIFTQGLHSQAMAAARRALEIAQQKGDIDYQLRGLVTIGIHQLFTGEHEAGLRTLEQFADVAARNDPSALPEGEIHVGIGELFLGRIVSARQRLETLESRDLRYSGSYRVRYLSNLVTSVRGVLSQVCWLNGAADTALQAAELAMGNARLMEHDLSLNNLLSYLCPVYFWIGEYDVCDRYVSILEEHVRRNGLIARRPVARFYRAALDHVRGDDPAESVAALQSAIEDFLEVNHHARMPYYLSVLSQALADQGSLEKAERTILHARDVAHSHKEGWCLPEVVRVQAVIAQAQGRIDDAESLLHESMALATSAATLSWRLRAACDLAVLWRDAAKLVDARAMLRSVLDEFTEGFATRDMKGAFQLLEMLEGGASSAPGGAAAAC